MRIVLDGKAGIDLTQASRSYATGSANSTPQWGLGTIVRADSGLYVYGQASGAIVEGYVCKFVEGTFVFDTCDHTEGDTAHVPLGICVTSGGLSDGQCGWFWRGEGREYGYVASSSAANAQLYLTSTAGQMDDSTAGQDLIHDLFTVAAGAGSATQLVYSTVLLSVNATITN